MSLLTADEEHWELQVETRRVTLQCPIGSPQIIREAIDFLRPQNGVEVLKFDDELELRQDGDNVGRYVLAARTERRQIFVDLLEDDVESLRAALDDLWREWQSE